MTFVHKKLSLVRFRSYLVQGETWENPTTKKEKCYRRHRVGPLGSAAPRPRSVIFPPSIFTLHRSLLFLFPEPSEPTTPSAAAPREEPPTPHQRRRPRSPAVPHRHVAAAARRSAPCPGMEGTTRPDGVSERRKDVAEARSHPRPNPPPPRRGSLQAA
jgi:hypothetical protein